MASVTGSALAFLAVAALIVLLATGAISLALLPRRPSRALPLNGVLPRSTKVATSERPLRVSVTLDSVTLTLGRVAVTAAFLGLWVAVAPPAGADPPPPADPPGAPSGG